MDIDDRELTSPYCPCCGRPTQLGLNPEWLLVHFVPGSHFAKLLTALVMARRERRTLSLPEVIDATYKIDAYKADRRRDDGDAVRSLIAKYNPQLRELGWYIAGPRTTYAGFALVPIE